MQGDCLIELPTDLKAPATWERICGTKKVNRYRPPEVAAAMAERDQASEKLQVRATASCACCAHLPPQPPRVAMVLAGVCIDSRGSNGARGTMPVCSIAALEASPEGCHPGSGLCPALCSVPLMQGLPLTICRDSLHADMRAQQRRHVSVELGV